MCTWQCHTLFIHWFLEGSSCSLEYIAQLEAEGTDFDHFPRRSTQPSGLLSLLVLHSASIAAFSTAAALKLPQASFSFTTVAGPGRTTKSSLVPPSCKAQPSHVLLSLERSQDDACIYACSLQTFLQLPFLIETSST